MRLYYSSMYDLGMIPESSSELREKQRLVSQKLANLCSCDPISCDQMYPVPVTIPYFGVDNNSCGC